MSTSKLGDELDIGSREAIEIRLARRQLDDIKRQTFALEIQLKSLKSLFRELEQSKSELEQRLERLFATVH